MAGLLSYASDILGTGVSGPAGVGGARPQDQYALQDVPGTGYQYDPVTGQYYVKGNTGTGGDIGSGTVVGAAPNLNQLTSGDVAIQQQYLQQQQQALQNAQQTRAGQLGLAGSLQDVIAGRAPSIAGIQAQQGLQQMAANQAAGAAGASGENAFAARRIAAQNTANAGTALNGQQALARAAEAAGARQSLGSLYTGMSGADTAQLNNATTGTLGTGNLATTSQGDITSASQKAKEDEANANSNLLGRIGSGLAAAF